ncbi:MAG: DciA family protein [Planctomycetota bacterium]|jgi:predicted nucleic acid-binding Zn ribbon protein
MASHEPIREIEQMRRYRARPGRDQSIDRLIDSIQQHASRTHRKLGRLVELWEDVLPVRVARRTAVTGLRGGTAHVATDSSATAYEVDRLLREGALAAMKRRFPGTLLRVRVRVAPDALHEP